MRCEATAASPRPFHSEINLRDCTRLSCAYGLARVDVFVTCCVGHATTVLRRGRMCCLPLMACCRLIHARRRRCRRHRWHRRYRPSFLVVAMRCSAMVAYVGFVCGAVCTIQTPTPTGASNTGDAKTSHGRATSIRFSDYERVSARAFNSILIFSLSLFFVQERTRDGVLFSQYSYERVNEQMLSFIPAILFIFEGIYSTIGTLHIYYGV